MSRLFIGALLLAVSVTTAIFAAPTKAPAKAPVLTAVTVAVTGFHCQECPDTLKPALAKLAGVTDVQATLKPAQVTAKLDESKITVSQFVNAIATHPSAMDPKKTYGATLTVYLNCKTCTADKAKCAACGTEVTKALKGIKGVAGAAVDPAGKVATVTFAKNAKVATAALAAALAKTSFKITPSFTAPVLPAKAKVGAGATCPAKGGCCPRE